MARKPLTAPTKKPVILSPVHPNVGLQAVYQRKLDAMIAAMNRSVLYWAKAQYRSEPPELASDASSAMGMRDAFEALGVQWQAKFDAFAEEAARWFGKSATARADGSMRAALKRAGFSIEFKMTSATNDALQAVIGENIALIKSIPAQYLTQVQGIALRSISVGGDLKMMTDAIEQQFGVTRRRAAFIARDQNNKATAVITATRQRELGITKARWVHSRGGREPRPDHVAFSEGRDGGPFYDITKGALISGEFILPGVKPGCRCVSRSVIEGLSDD